jgi:flagellar biosynthesis/type III secretory pathway protein FliH
MSAFCIDTITVDASLRPENGILRVPSLAVTRDAQVAAQRILQQARTDADTLSETAREEARHAVENAERESLRNAGQLLKVLEKANETFLMRTQDMIVDLAQGLFDRLVLEATPRERIEAALRRVQHEAPSKLAVAVLRVHPEDVELLPELEWEVKTDPTMARGVCRLEASGGEWCADFNAAVAALKSAFAQAVQDAGGDADAS